MNNNNLYKRPMFRKGGSAEGGITSGLQRPGYNVGNRVTEVMDEMRTVLPARGPKRNFNDFLINFGLDIASRSPQGNIFQTAAQAAKEPFDKFQTARAGQAAFDDKLALGAYDVVKGEQAAEKEFGQKKELIELEARLNPKTKKKFRENEPVVRRSDYAKSLEENEFDFIANNSMQIADDIVNFEMYVDSKPESEIAGKKFRGILPYAYDNKGKPVPNYESIQVDQVFYNPEDGLFYERVAEEGIIGTDFRALDPFTYD